MAGKRRIERNILATKKDILSDVLADTVSQDIAHQTGIPCSARENTEIRVNLMKIETLVREFDLNNPNKEVPMYEPVREEKGIQGVQYLKGHGLP